MVAVKTHAVHKKHKLSDDYFFLDEFELFRADFERFEHSGDVLFVKDVGSILFDFVVGEGGKDPSFFVYLLEVGLVVVEEFDKAIIVLDFFEVAFT